MGLANKDVNASLLDPLQPLLATFVPPFILLALLDLDAVAALLSEITLVILHAPAVGRLI